MTRNWNMLAWILWNGCIGPFSNLASLGAAHLTVLSSWVFWVAELLETAVWSSGDMKSPTQFAAGWTGSGRAVWACSWSPYAAWHRDFKSLGGWLCWPISSMQQIGTGSFMSQSTLCTGRITLIGTGVSCWAHSTIDCRYKKSASKKSNISIRNFILFSWSHNSQMIFFLWSVNINCMRTQNEVCNFSCPIKHIKNTLQKIRPSQDLLLPSGKGKTHYTVVSKVWK